MLENRASTQLYIVRHGESDWNVAGKLSGHSDLARLTKNGEAQAYSVAERLRTVDFNAIYTSDLTRAAHTAAIVRGRRRLDIIANPALRERNFGEYEGRSHKELRKVEQRHLEQGEMSAHFKPDPSSDYESDYEVFSRVLPFLSEVVENHSGQTVLLTTHYGIMRLLLYRLNLISRSDFPSIHNTAYLHLSHGLRGLTFESSEGITLPNHMQSDSYFQRRLSAA